MLTGLSMLLLLRGLLQLPPPPPMPLPRRTPMLRGLPVLLLLLLRGPLLLLLRCRCEGRRC